jgi:uncharacterized membrane protein
VSASSKTRLAESTRVEAFSDGVFAVAITILVLELHAPETKGEFLHELLAEWQTWVAYFAAFLIIGTIWLTHHALFTRIDRVDSRLMLHNLAQLLFASLMPFAASMVSNATRVGDEADLLASVLLFAALSAILSINWYLLTLYVERSPHLLVDEADTAFIRADRRAQPISLLSPILAALIAIFVSPLWGFIILGLSPVYYLVTVRLAEKRALSA